MFIKNIIISGFRSYREQSFPDGLSPRTNVIVGKNGSGKSNFFAAIQFVLNEKFANLRTAERKELFHVGSGRPALSVFVEIVFDNSDGRLVIPGRAEEPEVRIRRTVGLKQDEFRVNDRKFSASDVHQLLESAGFSSSNPYYVVEQGKIVSLVNMSEEERYQLIKDVAGTKVYDARRAESEHILAETKGKQGQITESIRELQRLLKELEAETAELKQYEEADRDKKCIEYCIFNAELEAANGALLKVEEEGNKQSSLLNKSQDVDEASEQKILDFSQKIMDISTEIARLEMERTAVAKDMAALTSKQAVVELDASEAAGRFARTNRELEALWKEDRELSATIQAVAVDIEKKKSLFHSSDEAAKKKAAEVETQRKVLERLQERRNRTKLFRNKAERDRWLSGEMQKNEDSIRKSKEELHSVHLEMERVEKEAVALSKQISAPNVSTADVDQRLRDHEERIKAALCRRDQLNHQRRQLWQSLHGQESVVQRLDEASRNAKQQWERAVRQDIRQGLQALSEVLHDLRNPALSAAVHGPLIDLIEVADGYKTAVEITAGNALFNVVVDSFEVSTTLLAEMNKRRKPGRVSFFPLDTCSGKAVDIATTPECLPLLSKIKYDAHFKGVVTEVFGRTAVVASLETAATMVGKMQWDVITVDGDQLGRRGGITGGFIDKRHMKLPLREREKELAAERQTARAKLDVLCQEVATVEQSITEVLNELEALRNQNMSTEREADVRLREARLMEDRRSCLATLKSNLAAAKKAVESSIAAATERVGELKRELSDDFKSAWTPEDEKRLEQLTEEVAAARVASSEMQASALQLATEVQLLEDTARHVERRKAVVADRIRELGWSRHAGSIAGGEEAAVKAEFELLSQRLQSIDHDLEQDGREREKLQSQLDALTSKRLAVARSLQERKEVAERTQMQRSVLVQRRDDALQKIRQLGVLPQGVAKFESASLGKLMYHLKAANEKLKGLSHVNRKALDQHAALQETMKALTSQQGTLSKELDSIHELMEHLDAKKEEAIERTYKQVQYQFEEVFKQLVGVESCSAELQLVASAVPNKKEDPYTGARIKVSFGLGNPVSHLEQLSGGQKSLVALALIFAIQRCDPAPFYLFDEIDAALDAEYRTSVANMMARQSSECQFLVATFKTELLDVADKVLGIFFHNKMSRIQTIAREEGVRLLKQAALEDRKRAREAE
ncbi:putative adaptor complex protein (AP) 3 delta subunit 1 [Leishmania major strain Friedlin]|uniref:Structural maintenance of chromosomes protein n=1 Tax=Leishmania major TaxID=5664 RepID=Q4QIG8_LEIMA|nr:putative adaptor complex protein (AP) 3 delta subunit 1 [Leishmania major strain Friedlin]CAG9569298.1 adaptor_complex_protein_(AP)_3_delta_subunit_1_-_putative [Leishmania major strain Friedlin]CAJ02179.1 putative adaptor complex protein (AP) 3 delta subunit 1 [Leishmania major strain Friedlin]|eukprot:XP_001681030.1 putative adaptor complex protein (AP) 3 delta subunit 1 [Leishmania major strain Friedlin]